MKQAETVVVAGTYDPLRVGRAEADLTDEQILERLLALNLERAAEEAKAQDSPKRKSAQRDKAENELIDLRWAN